MFVQLINVLVILFAVSHLVTGCTDFFMNFTEHSLSARTLDLGTYRNWTLSAWPRSSGGNENQDKLFKNPISSKIISKDMQELIWWPNIYSTFGISGNWLGDDHYKFPTFFADGINEKGLSCSMLSLVGTKYQKYSPLKTNVFAGVFCHYVTQNYATVNDLQASLHKIAIWGPDLLAQHFIIRDASGASLVIECIDGEKRVYLDLNDNKNGFGITTNEPTFDWHLENIRHYQWKRTLSRQAVATPGNFYPEERFLRVYMVKSGMEAKGIMTDTKDYKQAIAYTAQVVNTISVPEGYQYGTDSSEESGGGSEGSADHTIFAVIRDHRNPMFYWRDRTNPTFRRLRLSDVDFNHGERVMMLPLEETGEFFIDVAEEMNQSN